MAASELACVYAALILHDDGVEISADNITTLTKAANVTVEPYWPTLFAKLFSKKSVEDFISSVGSAPVAVAGAAPAAAAAGAADAGAAKEEAPKEESEEEEARFDGPMTTTAPASHGAGFRGAGGMQDMGFSLFD